MKQRVAGERAEGADDDVVTLGAQQLTATLVGDASVSGSGTTAVHGFVYTDPTPGIGKVRIVLNTAYYVASPAERAQLPKVRLFKEWLLGRFGSHA